MQVSSGGATQPHWAPDGKRLFYRTANILRVVTLDASGTLPRVVREDSLFARDFDRYVPRPDGKGFITTRLADAGPKIVVVTNWWQDVRSRLRGK
ncbi:hypothetical protein BH09GEM1_BH09GEM1_41040 [soil metagenome]